MVMNKLVPCTWLLSGALEVWRLRINVNNMGFLYIFYSVKSIYHGIFFNS